MQHIFDIEQNLETPSEKPSIALCLTASSNILYFSLVQSKYNTKIDINIEGQIFQLSQENYLKNALKSIIFN